MHRRLTAILWAPLSACALSLPDPGTTAGLTSAAGDDGSGAGEPSTDGSDDGAPGEPGGSPSDDTAAPGSSDDGGASTGGPPPDGGTGGDIEALLDASNAASAAAAAITCPCYAALIDQTVDECIGLNDGVDGAAYDCLVAYAATSPAVVAFFACEVEREQAYLQCLQGESCLPPHACDGTSLRGDFVCDGFVDCDDGSDEWPGCTPGCFGHSVQAEPCPIAPADADALTACVEL